MSKIVSVERARGVFSFPIHYPVACHTDNVNLGSTFVAIKGNKQDGIDYIKTAIEKGATKIVMSKQTKLSLDLFNLINQNNIELIFVENTRKALAELSAQSLGWPARNLKIIGITGTKGKTTTAYLLEYILKQAGYKTALLSSVANKIVNSEFKSALTTAQPDYLHVFFDLCKKNQVDFVVMEVAAQALSLYRVYGIEFESVIFTNFALEHSEFYPTIDDYFQAKVQIFNQLKQKSSLSGNNIFLNKDDASFEKLSKIVNQQTFVTYGMTPDAQVRGFIQANTTTFVADIFYQSQKSIISVPALFGSFSLSNILAAVGFCLNIGIGLEQIKNYLLTFTGVPGRLEQYKLPNGALGIIDYAHNPSSFEAVLSALKSLRKKLIVVFGAGGDRDSFKRPLMGQIASQFADNIILTSDNPRSEEPIKIIDDIKSGISVDFSSKVSIELDREIAIKRAYQLSDSACVIALLGKGPDKYQIVNGVKTHFDESEILKNF